MTGRLNGVGDARRRRCAADDLFSRICSEPAGTKTHQGPAGSRARNRVSKSARFRPAARWRQSAKYSGFSGEGAVRKTALEQGPAHAVRRHCSVKRVVATIFLIQKISNCSDSRCSGKSFKSRDIY
ncbi:hypothetical protein CRM91_33810 [Burkholderia ambifaria]|nr:hypothetical protein CRM91_33810 [Burkholderia ambifaria]